MIEFRGNIEGEDTADAVAVGVGEGLAFDDAGQWLLDNLPWLAAHLESAEFTGKAGQSIVVPGGESPYRMVAMMGLGAEPTDESVRRAAGGAARALSKMGTIATTLHEVPTPGAAEAVGFGFSLGTYSFGRYKSEPKPSKVETVVMLGADDDAVERVRNGATIAEGVRFTRDLVNEPAMAKSPETIASLVSGLAEEAGIAARVLDEHEIETERLGGLRAVSFGSVKPPRLVELSWDPPGAKGFLALVGKGIVFDSGGLSLKSAEGMEAMKTDMAGAAAVFGGMLAIARLGIPVKVVGIAPLTENMPSGSATKPGDVFTARNGKTVEVLNTDAEGRLVLADGLSLAAEMEPDLILDLATLTGSVKIALGEKIAGVFGGDEAVEKVVRAADAAGERVWRMPMPDDYRKLIDSDIADMKNTAGRWGGSITAALLLREFVGDVPWAHLDIAGSARTGDAEHYISKGGTGFGVRTIVALARQFADA